MPKQRYKNLFMEIIQVSFLWKFLIMILKLSWTTFVCLYGLFQCCVWRQVIHNRLYIIYQVILVFKVLLYLTLNWELNIFRVYAIWFSDSSLSNFLTYICCGLTMLVFYHLCMQCFLNIAFIDYINIFGLFFGFNNFTISPKRIIALVMKYGQICSTSFSEIYLISISQRLLWQWF